MEGRRVDNHVTIKIICSCYENMHFECDIKSFLFHKTKLWLAIKLAMFVLILCIKLAAHHLLSVFTQP